MPNIETYLAKIRSAVYGEEVRGSIHDAIQAMNAEIVNSDQVHLRNSIASQYSASAAYEVGDYVFYPADGVLYRCITAISSPGEAWNSGHWTRVELGEELDTLKSAIINGDSLIVAELNRAEKLVTGSNVTDSHWENETRHGYGVITSEYLPTPLYDKVILYNTSTFAAYVEYYSEYGATRSSDHYIGDDSQYLISKTEPYFKVWFYRRDQSAMIDADLSNIRIEKRRPITDAVALQGDGLRSLIEYNGDWRNRLGFIIGGFSLADSRVGSPIFMSGVITRIRSTIPLIINHNNAIVRPLFNQPYQLMWAKVDDDDVLLSFGGYVRTAILDKGKYYLLFRKSDGLTMSETDLQSISDGVNGYVFFDDQANSIDYKKLFCLNWYAEVDGKVRLGDPTWTILSAVHSSVVIPEFYVDHDIYLKKNTDAFRWRDSISDSDGKVIYSSGYIDDTDLRRLPSGYHHIMVTGSTDCDALSNALDIYATRPEVLHFFKNKSDVVARNIDTQNMLNAIRKPDKFGGSENRTILLAHGTDSHGDYMRWMNFLEVVNYYQPDLVAHTGDMVHNDMLSDTKYFLDNLPSMPTLLAMGNHEVGVNHDIGSGGATNETLFNDLIVPLNEKYDLNATKAYYSYTTKSLQYTGGIKFIVLNVYDYDANDGTHFIDRAHIYYSQAQISWLINELQNALTNNNPVIVCAHECDAYLSPSDGGETPFNQTYEMATFYSKTWSGNPICDLLEAFINGTSINQTYTETGAGITITVNTSFATKGHFVCWLVGHRHADHMGFLPGYSQLVISPCATACSIDSRNSAQGYSDLPRREGDRCEDAFNLYAITPDIKKIGIVRIGSNINYDLRKRDSYSTTYIKTS